MEDDEVVTPVMTEARQTQGAEAGSVESATEFARALAARRRIVEGVCEVCGAPFRGTTKRRYCSQRCNLRASRSGMSRPYKNEKAQEEAHDAKGR
jgi:hypothetical protein